MSTLNNPLLEAKGITKYFGTITALENVDLKVHAGECLGVVGDNGAGKSTLMKVLSGLYKPSSGSLYIQGKKEILESDLLVNLKHNFGEEITQDKFQVIDHEE